MFLLFGCWIWWFFGAKQGKEALSYPPIPHAVTRRCLFPSQWWDQKEKSRQQSQLFHQSLKIKLWNPFFPFLLLFCTFTFPSTVPDPLQNLPVGLHCLDCPVSAAHRGFIAQVSKNDQSQKRYTWKPGMLCLTSKLLTSSTLIIHPTHQINTSFNCKATQAEQQCLLSL